MRSPGPHPSTGGSHEPPRGHRSRSDGTGPLRRLGCLWAGAIGPNPGPPPQGGPVRPRYPSTGPLRTEDHMDARAPSKARWTSTIRIKLVLTIIVAAVIPLLIVGYASYTKQESLELDDAFERLEGLATAQVGQLERLVQADADTASIIANHPDVGEALTENAPTEETTATLENLINVVPRLEAIALFDGDGNQIAATANAASSDPRRRHARWRQRDRDRDGEPQRQAGDARLHRAPIRRRDHRHGDGGDRRRPRSPSSPPTTRASARPARPASPRSTATAMHSSSLPSVSRRMRS